ncbi:hypothetical protein BJY00DRAFT_63297 [Aspergillus carlsbadensis]|nr:hypothetical protein BJY00DRAFT_63297 [Aspergillus carlsbadensis]
MSLSMRRWAFALALLVRESRAQSWTNTVNVSMCTWTNARVNTIRDTVYLDGGALWWQIGSNDGSTRPESDNNNEGLLYYLHLNETFNTATTNLTSLFGSIPKAGGIANNLAPTYRDGVMFANDNKFWLYGGLLPVTASQAEPSPDQILAYELYQYGPHLTMWERQFINEDLDNDITRYITSGAGVSSPSENLGFYISGLHGRNWGPIYSNGSATELSQNMIQVDMSEMRDPVFTNVTLPDFVEPRANAEAVWAPVGDKGVVVLIGGVRYLESIIPAGLTEEEEAESARVSPGYMSTVAVYDVAGERWYLQNTTGDIPPQLTQFCSVYASASGTDDDTSTHNIYIYGGYDGLQPINTPSDSVYVLSLPSFEWIQLYDGDGRGRKGHKCVKPYPDQMLVLGGAVTSPIDCVDDMVKVFNLNTGRFQERYDPMQWGEYVVPDLVASRVRGRTSPSSWTNASLSSIFTRTYPSQITTYYPYNATNITTTTLPNPDNNGSGFPSWAGAVIGVVVGVLVLGGAFTLWFLRRRRKLRAAGGRRHSEASRGSRVMQWVHAGAFSPPNVKDPDGDGEDTTTVSGGFTSEAGGSGGETVVGGGSVVTGGTGAVSGTTAAGGTVTEMAVTAEAAGEPVYEMQGTSRGYAVELPTAYNENPLSHAAARSPGSAPSPAVTTSPATTPGVIGYTSPVSPEFPQEKEADVPASATTTGGAAGGGNAGETATRPGHTRNVSSLSSMQSYSTQLVEADSGGGGGGAQRPKYVSGVSEASISSAGTRIEEGDGIGSGIGGAGGVRRENRGLGLEDIPDTEAER